MGSIKAEGEPVPVSPVQRIVQTPQRAWYVVAAYFSEGRAGGLTFSNEADAVAEWERLVGLGYPNVQVHRRTAERIR